MIELVKTPTSNTFFNLVSNCNNEMILCAPYIKNETVNEILNKKKSSSKLTVITSSNISNFIQRSSDLSAIRKLLDNKATVLNYQDLHAKIYLFDKLKALITSANLTYYGMYHNYEYGVLIDNNDEIMDQIETDFLEMFESKLYGEFDDAKLDDIEKTINNVESTKYVIKEINGDNTLVIEDVSALLDNMSSWQKDVFFILDKIPNSDFVLKDVYKYKDEVALKYPNNHNIEPKIRQILQQLRDLGLVKFTKSGQYKKLFIHNGELV